MQKRCRDLSSKLERSEQELAAVQAKFAAVSDISKALEEKLAAHKSMVADIDLRVQNLTSKSEPCPGPLRCCIQTEMQDVLVCI